MSIRDKALELAQEAHEIYMDEGRIKEDARIDQLSLLVQTLAGLVAASAPEFKEAP